MLLKSLSTLTLGRTVIAACALFIAAPTWAASTFLLQLGEHKSVAAAQSQWDDLQTNNPELLTDLNLHVSDVNLGSETKYRTQASALPTLTEAQSRCNALEAQGVSCRVVETSMYQPAAEIDVISVEDSGINSASNEDEFEDMWALPEKSVPTPKTSENRGLMAALLPWLRNDETEVQAEPEVWMEPEAPHAANVTAATTISTNELMDAEDMDPYSQHQTPQPSAVTQPQPETLITARAPQPLNQQLVRAEQPAQPLNTTHIQPQTQGSGQVEVAEAIRVPLSFGDAAPVPTNKPVGYGGFPSEPLPRGTLWVQLNYFTSKDAAMDYWRSLSIQNPELTRLLRTRIITPWQSRRLNARSSLRMGPFSDQNAVNRLCAVAQQQNLTCVMVNEVGTTGAAAQSRYRTSGPDLQGRKIATPREYGRSSERGMYWLHLGGYPVATNAESQWSQLQTIHSDVLGHLKPQISYPTRSSSAERVYHLRAGPYAAKGSADHACSQLNARNQGCVVVKGR